MRAIAMRVTQEQYEAIKPKLIGLVNICDSDFAECPYLTSPIHSNSIVSNQNMSMMNKSRIVYELWNEKVFLDACGIETKPSIEEVKEYFKNAKEVECIRDKDYYIIDLNNNFIVYKNDVYIEDLECNNYDKLSSCCVWDKDNGYAKIISHKEETYQITKETVLKYQMKDEFPECFEKEIKQGEYWFHNTGELCLIDTVDKENVKCRHIDNPEYFSVHGFAVMYRKATPMEVQQALEKEAVKRGFKEGVYLHRPFWNDLKDCVIDKDSFPDDTHFYYNEKEDYLECYGYVVYSKGIWAEIIPTLTIKEAEEKLNCKII